MKRWPTIVLSILAIVFAGYSGYLNVENQRLKNLLADATEEIEESVESHRPVEIERYPCLGLARAALRAGGVAPGIFNAANEIAVDAFVEERIKFVEIAKIVEKTLELIENGEPVAIEEVLEYDTRARNVASELVAKSH